MPLWLPVGLVEGVAAWFWLPSAAAWIGFLLAMAAIALLGLVFGRFGRAGRVVPIFAMASALGCGLVVQGRVEWRRANGARK